MTAMITLQDVRDGATMYSPFQGVARLMFRGVALARVERHSEPEYCFPALCREMTVTEFGDGYSFTHPDGRVLADNEHASPFRPPATGGTVDEELVTLAQRLDWTITSRESGWYVSHIGFVRVHPAEAITYANGVTGWGDGATPEEREREALYDARHGNNHYWGAFASDGVSLRAALVDTIGAYQMSRSVEEVIDLMMEGQIVYGGFSVYPPCREKRHKGEIVIHNGERTRRLAGIRVEDAQFNRGGFLPDDIMRSHLLAHPRVVAVCPDHGVFLTA